MTAVPSRRGENAAETALYAPVKALLERHGYTVKGEVRGCDIVALGPAPVEGEPPMVIVELKRAVTLAAVLQAVDRFAVTELVYLAVPSAPDRTPPRPPRRGEPPRRATERAAHPANGAVTPYTPKLHRLCRRLGLGLLAVETLAGGRGGAIAIPVLDPAPPGRSPRRNPARAALVRREHARRAGDPNTGGTPGGIRLITAYRQAALRCAAALDQAGGGPLPVRAVREVSGAAEAGRILYRNVYGWFEPVGRDLYRLTEAGARDLALLAERAEIAASPRRVAAE
jgi:hypothetical protein